MRGAGARGLLYSAGQARDRICRGTIPKTRSTTNSYPFGSSPRPLIRGRRYTWRMSGLLPRLGCPADSGSVGCVGASVHRLAVSTNREGCIDFCKPATPLFTPHRALASAMPQARRNHSRTGGPALPACPALPRLAATRPSRTTEAPRCLNIFLPHIITTAHTVCVCPSFGAKLRKLGTQRLIFATAGCGSSSIRQSASIWPMRSLESAPLQQPQRTAHEAQRGGQAHPCRRVGAGASPRGEGTRELTEQWARHARRGWQPRMADHGRKRPRAPPHDAAFLISHPPAAPPQPPASCPSTALPAGRA